MLKASQPADAGYQITAQIPSVFLDKETVALVEAYLMERGSQVDAPHSRREALFLSIIDSSGAARLRSIKDYPFRAFDNGIDSLFISYGVFGEALSMSVSFSKRAAESHVSVNYRGAGARKIGEGLADGVIAILEDFQTSNGLYHPAPSVRRALTALFVAGIGIELGIVIAYQRIFEVLLPLILILYSYLYLAPMLNPYTTFDTPRSRRTRGWSSWLVGAGLTLLLLWFAGTLAGSPRP